MTNEKNAKADVEDVVEVENVETPGAETHAEADDAPEKTGEVEGPEEPAREPYQLDIPGDVPASAHTDEVHAILDGFGAAAANAGLSQEQAQLLVESFVDADSALGGYGNGESAYRMEDCERVLRGFWGSAYDAKMVKVWATVAEAGPALTAWLNESQMGNHPSAIIALSLAGDMALSKDAAARELSKLTAPKSDYHSLDSWRRKSAVARVQLLSRIVHKGEERRADARPATGSGSKPSAQATARAEAQKMLADKSGALMNSGHSDHAAAVKRFHELTARL